MEADSSITSWNIARGRVEGKLVVFLFPFHTLGTTMYWQPRTGIHEWANSSSVFRLGTRSAEPHMPAATTVGARHLWRAEHRYRCGCVARMEVFRAIGLRAASGGWTSLDRTVDLHRAQRWKLSDRAHDGYVAP